MKEYAALVGIDWADEQHAVALKEIDTNIIVEMMVEHKPATLHEWVNKLRRRFGGRKIAIAMEQSRGALIYALMRYEFLVLYPINPKSLARYREALRTSGAKDDPSDAKLLLSFLSAHQEQLRPWVAEDDITRQLGMLVEFRRKLVSEVTRTTNRLTSYLKSYYPQALEILGNVDTKMACDFLEKWPSLLTLQKAKSGGLRKFFLAHNSRSAKLIEDRIALVKAAVPLTEDCAIVSASIIMVGISVRHLRELLLSLKQLDKKIADVFQLHPDREIYESLPGAGPVLEPRLAAAMGTNRERYASAIELQQFTGTAPVTRSSGKSRWVHRRLARPKFLMQTHVEFAAQSIGYSPWAAAYYHQQIDKGSGRHAAVRALAYKWDRILFRCWKDRHPYDEAKYLKALERTNSPLLKIINNNNAGWTSARQILKSLKIQKELRSKLR